MRYMIVSNRHESVIEKDINNAIDAGWLPQGGLSVIDDGRNLPIFRQAMVKRDDEPVQQGKWHIINDDYESTELVLVLERPTGAMEVARLNTHGDWENADGYSLDQYHFTHWQPLPELP